jgi:hypothetical protein
MYGWTAPALDRPRPDERHLDSQVFEVRRPCAQEALHLRPTLDLERADGVGGLDLLVHVLVVERDPREVDRLVASTGDPVDAVLDRRQHPQPEQVDLQEPRVGAGILVPLADLPALHRRRHHRHELDEGTRRDHHPAGVLREVPRQPRDLLAEPAQSPPAARDEPCVGIRKPRDLIRDPARVAVRHAGEPLELGGG